MVLRVRLCVRQRDGLPAGRLSVANDVTTRACAFHLTGKLNGSRDPFAFSSLMSLVKRFAADLPGGVLLASEFMFYLVTC
jgi:hypothetical protein